MHTSTPMTAFWRLSLVTVLAVYLLIFVGGVVRASGSGMGCPDWPTCFGRLIPPTQESELPSDYHERYVGYGDTTFNPLKTWTEYLNRLLGASIGLLILGTLLRSLPLRKRDPVIFRLALLTFILVGFQGWLGSRVVASELKPTLISAHMIVALIIVSLLIFMTTRARRATTHPLDIRGLPKVWHRVIAIALLMTLVQVSMGTQIREAVDGITNQSFITERSIWREHFPIIFYIHRSFSSIILMTNLWLVFHLMRSLGQGHPLKKPAMALASLVIIAILTGVSLDRLGFPAMVQPFHLLLANLIFGCQFFLWLTTRHALKETPKGL
ncbi:MAG: COX15/CtaA family protein [Methylococcaceae bacterium]